MVYLNNLWVISLSEYSKELEEYWKFEVCKIKIITAQKEDINKQKTYNDLVSRKPWSHESL